MAIVYGPRVADIRQVEAVMLLFLSSSSLLLLSRSWKVDVTQIACFDVMSVTWTLQKGRILMASGLIYQLSTLLFYLRLDQQQTLSKHLQNSLDFAKKCL
jgi:hypothetical protein